MTQDEVIKLLNQNGYSKHPIFKFYYIPKKSLGHYFYPDVVNPIVGKIKWNNITLNESKEVSTRNFNPHNYGLVTTLDLKIRSEHFKRIALSKHKQANKKDNFEPTVTQEVKGVKSID